MTPLYGPPPVELAWSNETPFGVAVRRLAIEIEGRPELGGSARVRCRDGERLLVQENQLFARSGGHTSNVFQYEPVPHEPCELTVQQFGGAPLLTACLVEGETWPGRCDPPLDPVPPADGQSRVHDLVVTVEDHPLAGPDALHVGFRVLLGATVPRIDGEVRATLACAGRTQELDHQLGIVWPSEAGESWVVREVFAGLATPCEVAISLAVRQPGRVHERDVHDLGVWCARRGNVTPGRC